MQVLTVPLMPASQWADYLAAIRRVLETTDDPGMLDLCRTRYGATPYEADAALAAVRGEQREDRIDSEVSLNLGDRRTSEFCIPNPYEQEEA